MSLLITTGYYKGLLLLLHIWFLQMFTLTGYNLLLEYDMHVYRVRQIKATFWRSLFSERLLLNNWLLMVTTIGYLSYYTSTISTSTTMPPSMWSRSC